MPFKTATELGLTQPQYCALVKTLVALEKGRLWQDFDIRFNMEHWGGECGTTCCIGGSAEALGALPHGSLADAASQLSRYGFRYDLQNLFYPYHCKDAWDATQKQAAVALRHYLTTGKENWNMAMETPQ